MVTGCYPKVEKMFGYRGRIAEFGLAHRNYVVLCVFVTSTEQAVAAESVESSDTVG